jgi:c-di-GMP-binding flagellar brake protein YcgR
MIFYIQLILIVVLFCILGALYLDEKYKTKIKFPTGKLTQLWDGSERRRYVRVSANVPIRYSRPKDSKNNIKVIKTKDISIGGICMIINEKLSPHIKLCMEIDMPSPVGPISAKGEVVWIKENPEEKNAEGIRYFSIGIEFSDVQPKDKERLFTYIRGLDKRQDG